MFRAPTLVLELEDVNGRTPLSVAAEIGNVRAVEKLLSVGAEIHATDNAGKTPLFWAAAAGQERTLELLIAGGADCRGKDRAGRNALSYAAEHGHHDACCVIVSALSSSPEEEQRGHTSNKFGEDSAEEEEIISDDVTSLASAESMILPLSHAVNSADEMTVQTLLYYGMSMYYQSAWEEEPSTILIAAKRGNPEILKLLIEAKVPGLASPDMRKDALAYARRYGHESTASLLISAGCEERRPHATSSSPARVSKLQRIDDDPDDSTSAAENVESATKECTALCSAADKCGTANHDLNRRTLFQAFESGNTDRVQEILRTSSDLINARNDDGQSPLILAVLLGDKTLIRYVLAREKLDPNAQDDTGCTALSLAIKQRDLAVANLLARRKDIYPMLRDNEGMTPLLLSMYYGLYSVTRMLLDASLAHHKDNRRRSLFHHAILASADDILQLLLEFGVPTDCPDEQGRTPLSHAAELGTEFGVQFLLDKGSAEANSADHTNRTPLSYAAERGQDEIIMNLVEIPTIDSTLAGIHGRTPLSYACIHSSAASRDVLVLLSGSSVDMPDVKGRTPLSWAAGHGSLHGCSVLLNLNAEINRADMNSRNTLSYAAGAAQADIVRLFLETEQNMSMAPDASGRSPLDWAASSTQNLEFEPYLDWHTFMVRKWTVVWLLITGKTTSRPEATSFDELLQYAIERSDQLAVSQLTGSSLKDAIECPEKLIRHAMCHGSNEMVRTVMESLSTAGFDRFNFPVLSFAASEGRVQLVKEMLSNGVEHKEADSYLPFGHAVSQGHVGIMRALLADNVSHANIADKAGRTPLIIACTNGQTDALTCLLQAEGIDVNGKDNEGRSALSHAVDAKQVKLVKLLLADSRVNAVSRDAEGRSPLFYAVARWSRTVVQLLYERTHSFDTTRKMH